MGYGEVRKSIRLPISSFATCFLMGGEGEAPDQLFEQDECLDRRFSVISLKNREIKIKKSRTGS